MTTLEKHTVVGVALRCPPFWLATLPTMDARYEQKVSLLFQSSSKLRDPFKLPEEEWLDDPGMWPPIEFGQIHTYLIESPGQFTKEKLRNYKSLLSYNYYISGWVQTVFMFSIPDTTNCILKAKVKPSQRLSDKPHEAWVGMTKRDGDVLCAHCTCMAGCGETCSHVASILFKVEAYHRLEIAKQTCTSLPCVWNQASTKNVQPSRIHDICFFKPKRGKSEGRLKKHQQQIKERARLNPDRPKLDGNTLFREINACSSKCAIFTVLPGYGALVEDHLSRTDDVNLPKQLYHLYKPDYAALSSSDLDQLVTDTFSNITITTKEADYLEKSTRNQGNSYVWLEHRRGLITASHFHSVLHYSGKSYPSTIVSKIMQYSSPNPDIPALKWGRVHEADAYQYYVNFISDHEDVTVRKCGLFINPRFPFLGASPDGMVSCSCCGDGLLEIKCPFKYKDILPTDNEAVDDKSYCLKRNTDGEIRLSTTHSYFDQIQGQMIVSEFKYCDFICWTNEGIFIERIYLDEEYEKDNFPKLKQFFIQFLLPELLTHSRDNSGSTSMSVSIATPSTTTSVVQHTSSKRRRKEVETSSSDYSYCVCKKDRPGRMIACDNPSCKVEWFHYACVNIKRAPKGAWFCLDCK